MNDTPPAAHGEADKPVRVPPVTTLDTEFFWEAAHEHRLAIQRCCACGMLRHPAMPSCPHSIRSIGTP